MISPPFTILLPHCHVVPGEEAVMKLVPTEGALMAGYHPIVFVEALSKKPASPPPKLIKFCGHDDCLVSAAMLEECLGLIPPRFIVLKFHLFAQPVDLSKNWSEPTNGQRAKLVEQFSTKTGEPAVSGEESVKGVRPLPRIYVHDLRVDRISMWGLGEPLDPLELLAFSSLVLGTNYRLPAAYEIALHFHSKGDEEMVITGAVEGCFWQDWWKETDQRFAECLEDLKLLQQDVLDTMV
jgi:hypothetical protein